MSKAIDLFAGAGGLSEGARRAGVVVTDAFEMWRPAAETYHAAHPRTIVHEECLTPRRDWSEFAGEDVDIVFAGPPCQPFSAAGKGLGHFDERDGFPAVWGCVSQLRPDVVVIENVKGLTYAKHRRYLDAVCGLLGDLDYDVQWRVLNAADYGVPQIRHRLFIVATQRDVFFEWPRPTHFDNRKGRRPSPHHVSEAQPWVTVGDALGIEVQHRPNRQTGLPETSWRYYDRPSTAVCNWQTMDVPEQGLARAETLLRPADTISGGGTATGGAEPITHMRRQGYNRRLTWQECAALQAFPSDYPWQGTQTAIYQQVGNAVPLAEAVFRSVEQALVVWPRQAATA